MAPRFRTSIFAERLYLNEMMHYRGKITPFFGHSLQLAQK